MKYPDPIVECHAPDFEGLEELGGLLSVRLRDGSGSRWWDLGGSEVGDSLRRFVGDVWADGFRHDEIWIKFKLNVTGLLLTGLE